MNAVCETKNARPSSFYFLTNYNLVYLFGRSVWFSSPLGRAVGSSSYLKVADWVPFVTTSLSTCDFGIFMILGVQYGRPVIQLFGATLERGKGGLMLLRKRPCKNYSSFIRREQWVLWHVIQVGILLLGEPSDLIIFSQIYTLRFWQLGRV